MRIPRPLLLTVTLAAILGSIFYLEAQKAPTSTVVQTDNSTTYKELVDPSGFINTEAFQISDYIGKKVILIDFWTYSCINCIRTQPYLNAWWDEYEDDGLLIIGVHTPEFEFEKDYANVEAAVQKFGVEYPVVLDNNKGTWKAYGNRYWPRKYLIDLSGQIVFDHIGEGSYDETEEEIQKALGLNEDMAEVETESMDLNQIESPEVYFGTQRNEYLANGEEGEQGVQTLTIPEETGSNLLYLGGVWDFAEEYAETQNEATVLFNYSAKNVYMVGSAAESTTIEVYVDGVLERTIEVQKEELYQLVEGETYGEHSLELRIKGRGVKMFTFTFG
jgi:thiol-disulfide isomerase/thioredoxin